MNVTGICGTPLLIIPLPIIPLTHFGGFLCGLRVLLQLLGGAGGVVGAGLLNLSATVKACQGNERQRNGFPDFIPVPFIPLPHSIAWN